MIRYEANLYTGDGLQLYLQGWAPETEPEAVVCLVHGLGEHCGRYEHVAGHFTRAGYTLLAFDLRGHGKSQGRRGHVPTFESYMEDIDTLLTEAKNRYPGKPRFLYGHSMGGTLVLNYTLQRHPDLAGVVATSPALRSPLENQKIKIILVKTLGSVTPTLSVSTGLNADWISRDPEVVKIYRADPLVHDRGTVGWAKEMLQANRWVMEHAAEFSTPLLLLHGTADQITSPQGSQEFANQVTGNCTIKLWDGLYHETHNEPEQDQVIEFVIDWLDIKL